MAGLKDDKLDEILSTVQALSALPMNVSNLTKEVSSFKDEIKLWKYDIDEKMKDLEQSMDDLNSEVNNIKDRQARNNYAPQVRLTELRNDVEKMDLRRSIRSYSANLLFTGIPESGNEKTRRATEEVLRQHWVENMDMQEGDAYNIFIADCHRMKGPAAGSKPRTIIAKFVQMSDKDFVLSHAKNLKNHTVPSRDGRPRQKFTVQQHYPPKLQQQKRELWPYYVQAAKAKLRRNFRVVDTDLVMFICGQRFYYGMNVAKMQPPQTPRHIRFDSSHNDSTHDTSDATVMDGVEDGGDSNNREVEETQDEAGES